MRIRTGYSFRHAVGMIDDVMTRLVACDYPVAPITDRASTFGFNRWRKASGKVGLRPVYGVEMAVTPSVHAKKPIVDHWTFLAVDSLSPLHELIGLATEQFRYEPLLTYEQAQATTGVVKIAGHRSLFAEMKPADDLFIGLSPSLSHGYVQLARAAGFQFIECSDNKFPSPDDHPLYEVVCGRNASMNVTPQWILTRDEWERHVRWAGEGLIAQARLNFERVAEACRAEMKMGELLKPERALTLRAMCEAGAAELGVDLSDPVYKERLDRELALIKEKDFEDYFYIISDIVNFARAKMLVGPARGSSCGSLVCYLLRITTIDPIPYKLIFERFIDVNRSDLPDIDIDFSDVRRDIVFDYVANKYGRDRVARLGTVALYKPRSAITETGAALGVPKWQCEAVIESLIERSSGDSRALQTLSDTFSDTPAGRSLLEKYPAIIISGKMEGHPRHYSQHAAGIVLTQEAVTNFVAVDRRTGATMCDKKDAEELNLLKIDALGLTQLSIFEDTLESVGLPVNHLDTIPLDDQKAFDVVNKQQFSGIFQFNGLALQSLAKQITCDHIEDLVSITALARPGPLISGGAHRWVQCRLGEQPVEYPHPIFEPFLNQTLGIVLYQEQVMEIGRLVGDLSWEQVSNLRKAMSRNLGAETFDRMGGEQFRARAVEKGISPAVVNKVWDDLCAYGAWAFNRSHSVAYGLISYWCCWLKAHFPFEFAAATLSHENDPAKQIQLLREMDAEGFKYLPVDKERSTARWSAGVKEGQRFLIGPLHNVHGIGPKLVDQIISARARGEPYPKRADKYLDHPTTHLDSLYPIRDTFKTLLPNPAERNIFTEPTPIQEILSHQDSGEYTLFCCVAKINPRDENEVIQVAKRGGRRIEDGMTTYLNLQLMDDTGTIFGKVTRWDFEKLGKPIVDRGRPGKALYVVRGRVRGGSSFRMITLKHVRYIGELGVSIAPEFRSGKLDHTTRNENVGVAA